MKEQITPKAGEVWMTTYQILRFITRSQAQIIDCDLHKGADGGDCVMVIQENGVPVREDKLVFRIKEAE